MESVFTLYSLLFNDAIVQAVPLTPMIGSSKKAYKTS